MSSSLKPTQNNMNITVCDSASSITDLIDTIEEFQEGEILYVDLEGRDLCRHGDISLMTMLVHPLNRIYIVDVHTLQQSIFSTTNKNGFSLKSVLEAAEIPKVFFDVRNDSDALHAHFGIALQGIEDVQLMENASRFRRSKRYLSGLKKCVEYEVSADQYPDKAEWIREKSNEKVEGYYEKTFDRPLSADVQRYCVGDVQVLPLLRTFYLGRLSATWASKVKIETEKRVVESQSPDYVPHGPQKALSPWG